MNLSLVKSHLRIDGDITDEDPLLEGLINAAYVHVEQITGTTIRDRTITLQFDDFPSGINAFELPVTPVSAITAVSYLDDQGNEQVLDSDSYVLDTRPVYPVIRKMSDASWPKASRKPLAVTVTVEAGFADLPEDVQAAMLLLIGHLYANREATTVGVTASNLPFGVEALLSPYKMHRVG